MAMKFLDINAREKIIFHNLATTSTVFCQETKRIARELFSIPSFNKFSFEITLGVKKVAYDYIDLLQ